ncbi:formate/nitrite transporter family protein [Erysipelothrix sp. HDW6C]|uniref:formate/nitrite transporter family protein n=1 Tax=Erysipelothrix sp. HDW6C TaxID=2714930 RepID=UPI0014078783|nr:formate/nitrite transporter family protein [Erysipelothrix sp. HDW6C]QIK68997.1 formate/nitrite transporter family protein [Erysipelothrix sp. HDW6C]
MNSLNETVALVSELGEAKVKKSLTAKFILGFIGGAMVALGYTAYIIVASTIPGGLGVFLGASIFPVGLIIILLAGGELITGNMTVVATALFNKKVSAKELVANWVVISVANIIGALFVSLVLGVYLGTLNPHVELVNKLATGKVHYDALRTVVSGIACNWVVGLAVWLCMSFKDPVAKIIGIWFPIMVFVILGYQHSVANVFLLSASMAYGGVTFMQFITNFTFAFIGNIIGGAVFVGLFYTLAIKKAK